MASKQESVISNPRIPSCTVAFNSALDKLELEIVGLPRPLGVPGNFSSVLTLTPPGHGERSLGQGLGEA